MDSSYPLSEKDIEKINAALKEVEEGKFISIEECFKRIKDKLRNK